MYCKHCGQPMKGGANFCGRCGEPLEAIAVSLAYVPGLLALCAAAAIHANGRRSDRNRPITREAPRDRKGSRGASCIKKGGR